MKIVFLDFDGVLNSSAYFRACAARDEDPIGDAGAIDPECVARLNRIVAATGAVVVVSSSWRHGQTIAQLRAILASRGFTGTVIGKTPDFADCCGREEACDDECAASPRGHEIREWLRVWPKVRGVVVESYVVLDDNSDMDGVRERFVKTDMDTGLTDAGVDRAIAMLGRVEENAP